MDQSNISFATSIRDASFSPPPSISSLSPSAGIEARASALETIAARDARVRFQEIPRGYYVDGRKMGKSVTELVHRCFPKFDKAAAAEKMLNGKYFFTAPRYATYRQMIVGKTKSEAVEIIAEYWTTDGEAKAALGTEMHAYIEQFYVNGVTLPDTKEAKLFMEFHTYVASFGFKPFRSEGILFSEEYDISGCVDMLYIHPDDEYLLQQPIAPHPTTSGAVVPVPRVWLVDWKRSEEIKESGFNDERGLGLLSDRQNCNLQHYSLQLRIYTVLLEKYYGVSVCRMTIVALHPKQETYLAYDVTRDQETTEAILAQHI